VNKLAFDPLVVMRKLLDCAKENRAGFKWSKLEPDNSHLKWDVWYHQHGEVGFRIAPKIFGRGYKVLCGVSLRKRNGVLEVSGTLRLPRAMRREAEQVFTQHQTNTWLAWLDAALAKDVAKEMGIKTK
jgi:hypothetical protein